MKKIALLASIVLVASLALSGCGKQEEPSNYQQATPQAQQEVQQPEEELDIDKEILNLDVSMDDIKDTGFSEDELSDGDLGI